MLPGVWRKSVIGIAWALSAQSSQGENGGFPEWLSGKPDVDRRADKCGIYKWFLNEADRQTGGRAGRDELVSKRVINIANKLVDYHLSTPADSYSAEVKYLVIGDHGPFHFEFEISNPKFEKILNKDCGQ